MAGQPTIPMSPQPHERAVIVHTFHSVFNLTEGANNSEI